MKGKVLIANRGEIAVRIMNACRDLDLDHVVVYTEADKDSEHVRQNFTSGERQNAWRIAGYTDPNELFAVADYTGCTAIHPGYGFLASDFRFARRADTRDRPIIFIGPNWQAIKNLGDRLNLKKIAKELDIPTIPGNNSPIHNEVEAERIASRLFEEQQKTKVENASLLIKAVTGCCGMGIEEVAEIGQVRRVFQKLQSLAKREFGYGGLFIEQCLRNCHHLAVQLVCSGHGERRQFGSRNYTILSTGHQNRIAIAPGFDHACCRYNFDTQEVLDRLVEYSLRIAEHVEYDSIGSWAWLVSRSGIPYLLDINPGIEPENDISARISYIDGWQPDLIREQIRLALGEKIGYRQKAIKFRGSALVLRVVAEDTRHGFLPWSGTVTDLTFPEHPWITVSTHIPRDRPYTIPGEFDPTLALATIWGDSIEDIKVKAIRFIDETSIHGHDANNAPIITNLDYLKTHLHRHLPRSAENTENSGSVHE